MHILLISAIANTEYLLSYLSAQVGDVEDIPFEDHHYFSKQEMAQIHNKFKLIPAAEKYILTTEKDAVRLTEHLDFVQKENLPIFVLPVEVNFIKAGSDQSFLDIIKEKLLEIKY